MARRDVFTPEEDAILVQAVLDADRKEENGQRRPTWNQIASGASLSKTGKQCRARWTDHLDRAIRKDEWDEVEDLTLVTFVQSTGTCWSRIAKEARFLNGRSANGIKNRYSVLRAAQRGASSRRGTLGTTKKGGAAAPLLFRAGGDGSGTRPKETPPPSKYPIVWSAGARTSVLVPAFPSERETADLVRRRPTSLFLQR